jgi:HK97 family phage portal protein
MFAGMFGLPAESLQIDGANSLKEITFYTCVKILSETIGKLPLKIYQDSGGIRKASDHYLYQLLKLRPNPYMSAFDFWKSLETQLDIHGNSYAYIDIVPGSWRVQGLYPLNSTKMRIFVDDVGLLTSKNKVWEAN